MQSKHSLNVRRLLYFAAALRGVMVDMPIDFSCRLAAPQRFHTPPLQNTTFDGILGYGIRRIVRLKRRARYGAISRGRLNTD